MQQHQIIEGIYKLTQDEDEYNGLSDGQIQELQKCLPNEDEEKSLSTIVRQSLSGPAERFMLKLMNVPLVRERLQFGLFVRQFDFVIKQVEIQISQLNNACCEVRNSQELILLFAIILLTGNILNQGTRIGNAKGFKLSSLKQLKGTKTTVESDKNLLHVILEQVRLESQEAFDNLGDILPTCEKVAELSTKEIQGTITKLQQYTLSLEQLSQNIDKYDGINGGKVVRNFYFRSKKDIERVHSMFSQAMQDFQALAEYLEGKVQGSKEQPSDVFSNLRDFKKDIIAAKSWILKREGLQTDSSRQSSPTTSNIISVQQQQQPASTNNKQPNNKQKVLQMSNQVNAIKGVFDSHNIRASIKVQFKDVQNDMKNTKKVSTTSSFMIQEISRDRRFARSITDMQNLRLTSSEFDKHQGLQGLHARQKTQIQPTSEEIRLSNNLPQPQTRNSDELISNEQSVLRAQSKPKSWIARSINLLKSSLCGFPKEL
eukprot:TRINITY_DN3661_c0_g1_i1.p1 TRINITY_DN3661_c0_g1~~TRINITY_DN3661_c0_g1_i1.p1  ORF type:complete len:531 (-),score=32.14 TRINITY_DN3661_c0_g1_i1:288-1745(-)